MPGRSYRIARIAGIPVGVSPWWLAVVALLSWSLGSAYFPEAVDGIAPAAAYALGLLSALLLFASILAHELGHALVARSRGIEVEEIDLWLLGGVAKMRGEASRPDDELRYALAGPAVTAVVVAVFAVLTAALGGGETVLSALVGYQLVVNGLILVFNMVPAFPLDGGRVLRALLWRRSHDLRRATDIAATVGRLFGFTLIALGALSLAAGALGGVWLAIVGVFIVAAASAQRASAEVEAAFGGIPASELMSAPAAVVPADETVDRAIAERFVPLRYTAFPVVDRGGRMVGVVTFEHVRAMPVTERATRLVGDVADRDPALAARAGDDIAELLRRPAFARVGRIVVVDERGTPQGVLSVTDAERAVRALDLSGDGPLDARRTEPPRGGSSWSTC